MPDQPAIARADVLIAGGGFAGLALAIALRQSLGERSGRGRRSGVRRGAAARPARLGDRGGGTAHVRDARRLGRGRRRCAADPRHGGHRLQAEGRGAAGVPDFAGEVEAGRAVRAHDRERAAQRGARRASARGRASSCAPRRSRASSIRARASRCRSAMARRSRRRCWSPPTARVRACASRPASRRTAGRTASRRSSRRWRMSASTTAAPRSISCPPDRSRSCR